MSVELGEWEEAAVAAFALEVGFELGAAPEWRRRACGAGAFGVVGGGVAAGLGAVGDGVAGSELGAVRWPRKGAEPFSIAPPWSRIRARRSSPPWPGRAPVSTPGIGTSGRRLATPSATRTPLRAETRELAEHCGERTQGPAVPAPPSARRDSPDRYLGVSCRRQRTGARRCCAKPVHGLTRRLAATTEARGASSRTAGRPVAVRLRVGLRGPQRPRRASERQSVGAGGRRPDRGEARRDRGPGAKRQLAPEARKRDELSGCAHEGRLFHSRATVRQGFSVPLRNRASNSNSGQAAGPEKRCWRPVGGSRLRRLRLNKNILMIKGFS